MSEQKRAQLFRNIFLSIEFHHDTVLSILRCQDNLSHIQKIWSILKPYHRLVMTLHAYDHDWHTHIKTLSLKPSQGRTDINVSKGQFLVADGGVYADGIWNHNGQSYPVTRFARTLDAIQAISPVWAREVLSTAGAGYSVSTCVHAVLAVNQPSCIADIDFTPFSLRETLVNAAGRPEVLKLLRARLTPEMLEMYPDWLAYFPHDDHEEVTLYI